MLSDNADDKAILQELGKRLARRRLNRNQTQAALAREAGISRRTVSKAENGYVIDSQSLVRILRALDLLDQLESLIPETRVSPMALVEARGRVRERATGYRGGRHDNKPAAEWQWPDETD